MTPLPVALRSSLQEEPELVKEAPRFGATTGSRRSSAPEPRASILVVDDDTKSLYALAEVLRGLGHRVVLARSGDEALHWLLRDEFALVLLDVQMQGLSGFETATLIRSRERTRRVPIIFVTGYSKDEAQVFEGYDTGAVDYLFKPVDPIILKSKVGVFADLYRQSVEIRRAAEERLRAERALREREAESAFLLRSLPIALYRSPARRDLAAPRLVRGNVELVTGFGAERFLADGGFWQSRLHPEDRERVLAAMAALAEGGAVTLEYRWTCPDGEHRTLLDQAVFVPDEEGGAIFGTWLDVTERKLLEERLHHAQKLEAIGLLTGSIAHDFNNLLAAISGSLDIIESAVEPNERVRRVGAAARRAIEGGAALTRQLLAFARREAVAPETFELERFVASMLELLQSSMRHVVQFELAMTPGLWPVRVDPSGLELAIFNIAANARDAMPEGGRLRITARNCTRRPGDAGPQPRSGEFVALAFADTGIGIPAEAMAHVFEPFFTTKGRGKGTGLGLAQVYGFAEQSGGAVEIESREGAGTCVTLYLPRGPASER